MKTTIYSEKHGHKITHPEWRAYMAARRTNQRARTVGFTPVPRKSELEKLAKQAKGKYAI